jgi:hypothetical protein
MDKYLITDEYQEAISSLEMFSEMLSTVHDNTYRWKWSIIVLHNALQCFMVLSLKDTNGFLTMSKKSYAKFMSAYENNNNNIPMSKLDNFYELYKKIKKYRAFVSTNEYDFSVKKLHSLRNMFIHFTPKSWLLEISALPTICKHILEIIHYLIYEGSITWYEDEIYQRTIQSIKDAEKVINTF